MPINSVYSTMSVYEQLMNDPLLEAERPLMQRLNLTDYIMPNLILDQQRTTQARNDLLSSISPASGMVMAGQRIIGQGDMVTETNYRVLNSLEREMQRRQDSNKQITYKMIGNAIYVFILVLLFTAYLQVSFARTTSASHAVSPCSMCSLPSSPFWYH